MIVVSNTSPITNLAAVARLNLLRELFDAVPGETDSLDSWYLLPKPEIKADGLVAPG